MKRIPASSVGRAACEIISRGGVFRVHSAFSKSIYIELGGAIVFDTPASRVRSETGVALDLEAFYREVQDLSRYAHRGEPVYVEGGSIFVGNGIEVDLRGSSVYEPHIEEGTICRPQHREWELLSTAHRIKNIAILIGRLEGEDLEILDRILGSVYSSAPRDPRAPQNPRTMLEEILGDCIGLGKGLTPSCDDLAAGIITTYNSIARACGERSMIEVGEELLKNTTEVSAYILRNASKGLLYEPIEKALRAKDQGEVLEALLDLLSIGHSSGPMIAIGVLVGLMIRYLYKPI